MYARATKTDIACGGGLSTAAADIIMASRTAAWPHTCSCSNLLSNTVTKQNDMNNDRLSLQSTSSSQHLCRRSTRGHVYARVAVRIDGKPPYFKSSGALENAQDHSLTPSYIMLSCCGNSPWSAYNSTFLSLQLIAHHKLILVDWATNAKAM